MSMFAALAEALIAVLPTLIISLVSGVIGMVCYVLMSWGMYSIAKRRGISKPWLAWLPYGCNWILGCISDQYQMVVKGKKKSRRKILLGLSFGVLAAFALVMAAYVVLMVVAVGQLSAQVGSSTEASAGILMILIVLVELAFLLVELAIAAIYSVFMYIALFDLFRSCNPDTSVLFLILSIVLGINALFVFLDRKKDLGMPAPEVDFEAPVLQEPVE